MNSAWAPKRSFTPNTRSPTSNFGDAGPEPTTTPANSVPSVRYFGRRRPLKKRTKNGRGRRNPQSVRLTVDMWTSTSTSSAAGTGTCHRLDPQHVGISVAVVDGGAHRRLRCFGQHDPYHIVGGAWEGECSSCRSSARDADVPDAGRPRVPLDETGRQSCERVLRRVSRRHPLPRGPFAVALSASPEGDVLIYSPRRRHHRGDPSGRRLGGVRRQEK